MTDGTKSHFRSRRGRILARNIRAVADKLGHDIHILDVGGRRDYWDNVGFDRIAKITLSNIDPADLGRCTARKDLFSDAIGDACNLSHIPDSSIDFYHSNSVIEHVGDWLQMGRMAKEAIRVSRHGWLQTPAWEFPIEPHFKLPFMHWFATPARAALLAFAKGYRGTDHAQRRWHAERINLLSKSEVRLLFPGRTLVVERIALLPKSYIVTW
jgi:hypothetical protein